MLFNILHTCSAANVEAPDENSYTPLLTAIANGESHAFQRLLERGAHIDVVDKDGRSSVFLAAKDNHIPILKVSHMYFTYYMYVLCVCLL